MSCWSAAPWLSVSGSSGELGDGFCRAEEILCIPAKTRSMDEAVGMGTLVGSHVRVSQIRWACVSVIQMV